MNTLNELTTIPVNEWRVDQVIVFDWFDGPRKGIARMASPSCEFAFTVVAERHCPDNLDDRLYQLSELPSGSVERTLNLIRCLGSPKNSVWVPVWRFSKEEDRLRTDYEIDRLLNEQKCADILIHSRDMGTFLGCWKVHLDGVLEQDWFVALGIN